MSIQWDFQSTIKLKSMSFSVLSVSLKEKSFSESNLQALTLSIKSFCFDQKLFIFHVMEIMTNL